MAGRRQEDQENDPEGIKALQMTRVAVTVKVPLALEQTRLKRQPHSQLLTMQKAMLRIVWSSPLCPDFVAKLPDSPSVEKK